MLKKNILSTILIAITTLTCGQENNNLIKKIANKFLSSDNDTSRSNSFFILPAMSYAQETGLEYGVAGNYSFYVDKLNIESRTSNILMMATMTTKNQKKINLNADLWTKNNEYHILAELRMRDWPFNFYGIGNDTWKNDEDYLDQTLYRAKFDIEKKIVEKLYIGINTSFDKVIFNDVESGGIYDPNSLNGADGGQYATIGTSLLFDSRDVTTYTNRGIYSRLKYAYAPQLFDDDDFNGNMLEADIRAYIPIYNKINLAAQIIYRGTYGNNVPFYTLRDLGGDMSMRGYYLGRYKDKNYLTTQAELRYRLHPRFGVTTFLGGGSTFSGQQAMRLVPSYGAGFRYFFSLEHSSSIRLDYAYGERRPGEARQSGFYLSISEAF